MATYTPFLKHVAEDLLRRFGEDMSDITVVFPNNRAQLFFNNHLASLAGKPVWTPQYTTILDLFRKCCPGLDVADKIKLVSELFNSYKRNFGGNECFDKFYFWGEILLSDFDDVDKNLADAKKLFLNIKEQAEYYDDLSHLDDDKQMAIQQFFQNFSIDNLTELKERFIALWDSLYSIYNDLKQNLEEQNIAYEGMLFRKAVERLKSEDIELNSKKYVFIGFNVLNECEKQLFSILEKRGQALFYWDYDEFYVSKEKHKQFHEAGTFMKKNLEKFPNALDDKSVFRQFNVGEARDVTFISASSENSQAKYLTKYLRERKENGEPDSQIAVVLCNEGLLLPALHSIPNEIEHVNVTMGFPLLQTPAFSLVQVLLAMQLPNIEGRRSFYYGHILPVIKHPYIRTIAPNVDIIAKTIEENHLFNLTEEELLSIAGNDDNGCIKKIFRQISGDSQEASAKLCRWLTEILELVMSNYKTSKEANLEKQFQNIEAEDINAIYGDLYKEALFRTYTKVNRMLSLIENDNIDISTPLLAKLLRQILATLTVPFSGEPVKGLQIMGFLETRNLDFDNVILLSVNEGVLPSSGKESSFIPRNLRRGYGLSTIEHKNSLYAYYFYRFLQRAKNITMLYNTSTDGTSKGQMSRFMLQLLAETKFNIKHKEISPGVQMSEPQHIDIQKTEDILNFMKKKYAATSSYFSPSALNCYLDCPLKFYFRHILGLNVKEELKEEVDASMFGTLFHYAAEYFYKNKLNKIGKVINKSDLEPYINKKHPDIEDCVDCAFKKEYFKIDEDKLASAPKPKYNGEQLIKRKVVIDFLSNLINIDYNHAPFTICALEQSVSDKICIDNLEYNIGGKIDRIDLKEGVLRIVDYKTGGSPACFEDVEGLFDKQKEARGNYIFQAFFYSSIVAKKSCDYKVKPALLYIHKFIPNQNFNSDIKTKDKETEYIESIDKFQKDFDSKLKELISEILDENAHFNQTEIEKKCSYCDFKNICKK